jgi:hypothetical protein
MFGHCDGMPGIRHGLVAGTLCRISEDLMRTALSLRGQHGASAGGEMSLMFRVEISGVIQESHLRFSISTHDTLDTDQLWL